MTELLYQTDSYLQEFDGSILSIVEEERAIILDRTAFYPGGGGQPCDFGTLKIGDVIYPVVKVKKQGDQVLHFLGDGEPLPSIGSATRGALDWARRYKLMRTHTALHILCGTIFRDYGALVTGGNMEPLKGHLDFEFATMRGELVREKPRYRSSALASSSRIVRTETSAGVPVASASQYTSMFVRSRKRCACGAPLRSMSIVLFLPAGKPRSGFSTTHAPPASCASSASPRGRS